MNPEEPIVIVGVTPSPPDRSRQVRERLLMLIGRGVPRFGGTAGSSEEWWAAPGACSWWQLRQQAGGRIGTLEFRGAVDGLIAEGRLIEVWLARPDGRSGEHVLLIPGHSTALRRDVVKARGRADVIRREPWGKAVIAAGRPL